VKVRRLLDVSGQQAAHDTGSHVSLRFATVVSPRPARPELPTRPKANGEEVPA
jgi:hypothetical protein